MRRVVLIGSVALLGVAGAAGAYLLAGETIRLPGSAPAPAPSPVEISLDSRSRASLPLRISFASIRTLANEGLPPRFEGDREDPIDRPQVIDDRLAWTVERGTLAVAPDKPDGPDGRRLKLSGPLAGTARLVATVDLGRGEGGGKPRGIFRFIRVPPFKVDVSGDLAGTLTIFARPEMRADYRIVPNLEADARLTKAEVPIRRLGRLDVRAPVQLAIDRSKARLLREAEKRIVGSDRLRGALADQWRRMFVVRQVKADPVTWLVIAPTGLEAAQPVVEADAIVFGIGVRAETRVVVAAAKPANPPRPLPDRLVLTDRIDGGGFDLEIPVSLTWEEVNRLANDPKTGGKAKLRIDAAARSQDVSLGRVALRPSGTSVLLDVAFAAKSGGLFGSRLEGTLHLLGRPEMRPGTDTLVFAGLEHHVATRDVLASAASWLASATMLQGLASNVAIDLEPALDRAADRARAQIAKSLAGLPTGVSVSVELDRIRVVRIAVTRDHLHVVVRATGAIGPVEVDLGSTGR